MIEDIICKSNINGKNLFFIDTKKDTKSIINYINSMNPDNICIELCESQLAILEDPEKWNNKGLIKVIREGQLFLTLSSLLLPVSVQNKFYAVIKEAKKEGIETILINRNNNITFKRAWKTAPFTEKNNFFNLLINNIWNRHNKSEEEISSEIPVQKILLNNELPVLNKILIEERNVFMASKIQHYASDKTIVLLSSDNSIRKVKKLIESGINYDNSLEEVPPGRKIFKILPWLITAVIISIFISGAVKGKSTGLSMLGIWVLSNGIFTSIAALLAFGHPLTILSSWIVAPLTSLNPTIGAGIVLAFIESCFRKPRIKDLETLRIDIRNIRGIYKNRLTKIMLVFIATSIGSTIGTFAGLPWITALLK